MALQVRETSLIAAGFIGVYVITLRPRIRDLAFAALGFAAPLAIEFAAYWMTTGDPLFRRHLSLAHTQIPTSELTREVDRSAPPFFNVSHIASWRLEPGVRVHWLIDPFLNLYINGKAGLSLTLVPLMLLVGREIPKDERRSVVSLYGLAIGYAAVLIYVLAIDPKARMMFVPLSALSLALALIVIRLWSAGKRLSAAIAVVGQAALGLTILFVHQRTDIIEGPAAKWIARYPGQIEVDPNTRRHLALVGALDSLPDIESNRQFLLYNSVGRCAQWAEQAHLAPESIVEVAEQPITNIGYFMPKAGGALCLFRYARPLTPDAIRSAILRSRQDGRYVMDPRIYLGIPQHSE